jgi:hypothetical protein
MGYDSAKQRVGDINLSLPAERSLPDLPDTLSFDQAWAKAILLTISEQARQVAGCDAASCKNV